MTVYQNLIIELLAVLEVSAELGQNNRQLLSYAFCFP